MIKLFVSLGVLLVIGLLGFYGGLYFYQAKLIFYPELLPANQKLTFGSAIFSEEFLKLSSGPRVHFLKFPQANSKGTILYFHGNAGSLLSWGYVGAELANRTGYDVWIMDYPGYGKSAGPFLPNEKSFLSMGHDFIQKIRQEKPAEKIFLFGRSIGSGVAGALAASEKVQGLLLETPYTTLKQLVAGMLPWVPGFLINYDFSNLVLKNSNFKEKILIVHGTADEIIPFAHAQRLSSELENSKLITIVGGHHNDLSNFPAYWPAIEDYFKSNF